MAEFPQTTASGIPTTLIDAKGDLIVGSADNAVIRKPVGTNGQVLTADSTQAGGVKWATPTAASGDVATDTIWDTKGDLAVATGADAAAKLAAGSDMALLMADASTASGLRWQRRNVTLAVSPESTSYTPTNSTATAGSPLLISGLLAFLDLTYYREVRFTLLTTTPFATGAKIRPQYSLNGGTTWAYMEASGTGLEMDGTVNDTASGLTAVVRKSAWVNLASGANAECDLRVVIYGQTATTAGTIRAVYLLFR